MEPILFLRRLDAIGKRAPGFYTSPGLEEPHKEGCLGEEQGETCSAVAIRGKIIIAPGSGLLFSGLHPGLSLASGNTKAAPTIDTSIQFIIFLS